MPFFCNDQKFEIFTPDEIVTNPLKIIGIKY